MNAKMNAKMIANWIVITLMRSRKSRIVVYLHSGGTQDGGEWQSSGSQIWRWSTPPSQSGLGLHHRSSSCQGVCGCHAVTRTRPWECRLSSLSTGPGLSRSCPSACNLSSWHSTAQGCRGWTPASAPRRRCWGCRGSSWPFSSFSPCHQLGWRRWRQELVTQLSQSMIHGSVHEEELGTLSAREHLAHHQQVYQV